MPTQRGMSQEVRKQKKNNIKEISGISTVFHDKVGKKEK